MRLMIIAAIAMLLVSCKKNSIPSISKITATQKTTALPAGISPGNPQNPYDSAGIWHNRMLNYLLPKITASGDTSLRGISETIATCGYAPCLNLQSSLLQQATLLSIKSAPDNYLQLINQGQLSQPAKGYLHSLIDVIKDTSDYSNVHALYTTKQEQIEHLEDQVIHDERLSPKDRQAVLEVTSVGRYSLYYWFPANSQGLNLKKIIRAIATVTGDIGGAIEGYFCGDIIGTASDASAWWHLTITYSMPEVNI